MVTLIKITQENLKSLAIAFNINFRRNKMPRSRRQSVAGPKGHSITPTTKALRSSKESQEIILPTHPHPHAHPPPSTSSEPKTPPPKIKITTPPEKAKGHLPTQKLQSIPQTRTSKAIYVPPSLDDFPNARELQHLRILRREEPQAITLKDVNSSDLALTGSTVSFSPIEDSSKRCINCQCILRLCKAASSKIFPTGKSPFLDNLKPIKARSRNSTEFIHSLLQFQAARKESQFPVASKSKDPAVVSKRGSSILSQKGSKVGPANPIGEDSPRAQAYKAILEGLQILRKGQHRFQQTVLMLTFT